MHLKALPNGHLLIAGTTTSYDMDFINNPLQSGRAVYFMELDTLGNILRTKMLSSNSGPIGTTIRDVTIDGQGNIYATGSTWHDNMDFAHVANGKDGWVLKLDSTFNKEWMRFWVGYGSDQSFGLGLIQNGNIAVTGVTIDTGTVAMLSHLSKGKGDLYIEAYNPQGATLWKGRYGGTENEAGREIAYGPNTDDIYVIGRTESATGDIGYHTANAELTDTNKLENTNIWILKLDTLGNLEHSKAYGSKTFGIYSQTETRFEAATFYNNNLWLAVRSPFGGGDFDSIYDQGRNKLMISTLDNKANLTSKLNFYETSAKFLNDFVTVNGKLWAVGPSIHSTIGPVNTFNCDPTSINNFNYLIRLEEAPLFANTILKEYLTSLFKLYPNPSHSLLHVAINGFSQIVDYSLSVSNTVGMRIFMTKLNKESNMIDCSQWPNGIYYINVTNNDVRQTQVFIKQ